MKKIFVISVILSTIIAMESQSTEPSGKLVFISDTQAPTWIEGLWLKSFRNEEATEILLNEIPEQKPSGIYFLGDVVNLGYKNKRWKLIDTSLCKIRAAGIAAYACLGNHDVMGRSASGEQNFQKRFPEQVNTGYMIIQDSIAIILLNSNFNKMTVRQISTQDEWYQKTLDELDTNRLVKAVIVTCHHSPYSDSRLVGSSRKVQEKIAIPFMKSLKARLFISGHAHLFEHFNVNGKNFLVIGGGGGLYHPHKENLSGYRDLAAGYKPRYHYITVEVFDDNLRVVSNRLKDDFSGTEEGHVIYIPILNM